MTDVTFRLHAPPPPADTYLRVVGGHPALGDWSPATAPSLAPTPDGDDAPAAVTVSLPPGEAVEYKYARVDASAGTVTWEGSDNRRLEVAPGAVVADHWEGGESPTLPCEGIVVPPPPVEPPPPTADDDLPPPADAPAARPTDASGSPTDALAPPAGRSPPPSKDSPAGAADASAPPDGASAPPDSSSAPSTDAAAPSSRMGKEPAREALATAAPTDVNAQALAADDTTVAGGDAPADGGGVEAEAAAKGGGDVNIFKHLSSGVSSLLRAMSRRDGGRGRRDSASPPPANGVTQAES